MNKFKKYFKHKFILFLLGAAVLTAGFFGYQSYTNKQAIVSEVIDTFEENIPAQCEKGEWIEFPDIANPTQYEKFIGNAKLQYDEQQDTFLGAEGEPIFTISDGYSLWFFMDRDVRIEGYQVKDNEVYIKKIKCVGAESDQNMLQMRRKLMNYITKNINTLALEKATKNDWQVETFYFTNDTDVYVQYESEGSFMEEAPYDSRLWLIRASKMDRNIPMIKTLAYIQEDAEDPEKNILKQGEDIYAEAKNLTIYEFDEDAKQWILQ